MSYLFPEHTVRSLPVPGLYEGTRLVFSKINYFFGANGSGKTLTLKQLKDYARNALRQNGGSPNNSFSQYIGPSTQNEGFYRDSYQTVEDAFNLDANGELNPGVFYQHLLDHPEIQIRVRDSIQRFLGRHPNLVKRGINNVMTFFRENDDLGPYSPTAESDGLRRLSLLLTYVYHPKCQILLIDEPELHLHPDMVSFLLQEVEEETKYNKQFFFATHSPEIIKIGKEDKFAYFYFDLHDRLRDSRIIDLQQVGAQTIMNELGYLLDANRRAFLFAPITLFVEGIKDEFVYTSIKSRGLVKWPRRIFMINTGGCSNIPKFVELWKKLNKPFRVILDNVNRPKRDAVQTAINDLCNLNGINSTIDLEEKKKRLENHNIYIADFPDVCDVLKIETGNVIHVEPSDLEESWDLFNIDKQINILRKALNYNEEASVRIRDIEEVWMKQIIAEITSRLTNTKDISASLEEIKKHLESSYPRLSIQIYPNDKMYMTGEYVVSDFRKLTFDFAKDSANHSFKASRK